MIWSMLLAPVVSLNCRNRTGKAVLVTRALATGANARRHTGKQGREVAKLHSCVTHDSSGVVLDDAGVHTARDGTARVDLRGHGVSAGHGAVLVHIPLLVGGHSGAGAVGAARLARGHGRAGEVLGLVQLHLE